MSDLFWRGVACALARYPRLLNRLLQVAYWNPYFHLPGYMERWWLLPAPPKEDEVHDYPGALPRLTRLANRLGVAARFHRILRADQGRHGHSHPWPFRTLILQGWYIEEIYNRNGELVGERRLRAGMTAYKTPDEFHRIRAISPGGVLTLVIHGKPTGKGWFFNRGGELIPWRIYLGLERKS